MNFFKDQELAMRFRKGQVSEKEQMFYCIAYALLLSPFTMSSSASFLWENYVLNTYDYISDVLLLIFTVFLTFSAYQINKAGDNVAFVARFISIGFPVAIKVIILSLVLVVFGSFLDNPAALNEENLDNPDFVMVTGPFTLGAVLLLYAYMYWRITSSMKIAAGLTAE